MVPYIIVTSPDGAENKPARFLRTSGIAHVSVGISLPDVPKKLVEREKALRAIAVRAAGEMLKRE